MLFLSRYRVSSAYQNLSQSWLSRLFAHLQRISDALKVATFESRNNLLHVSYQPHYVYVIRWMYCLVALESVARLLNSSRWNEPWTSQKPSSMACIPTLRTLQPCSRTSAVQRDHQSSITFKRMKLVGTKNLCMSNKFGSICKTLLFHNLCWFVQGYLRQ